MEVFGSDYLTNASGKIVHERLRQKSRYKLIRGKLSFIQISLEISRFQPATFQGYFDEENRTSNNLI